MKFKSETLQFVSSFYNGNYKIVGDEVYHTDDEKYVITKISSDNIERGYIVEFTSEKKVVFVDKNETTKKLTYYDLSFTNDAVEFDFNDNIADDDDKVATWKFLGFNFKKFFGRYKTYGPEFSLEPGSCYRNVTERIVILGLEYGYVRCEPC